MNEIPEAVKQRLDEYVKCGRFPRNILLLQQNSDDSVCKYIAALIISDDSGDGSRILRGVHPDVIDVLAAGCDTSNIDSDSGGDGKTAKAAYKIEQIRAVVEDGNVLPNEAEYKVYIFRDLQDMSVLCQNALLKFLEEPPVSVYFVFTATGMSALLPTVISRLTRLTVPFTADTGAVGGGGDTVADDMVTALLKPSHMREYYLAAALSRVKRENLNSCFARFSNLCAAALYDERLPLRQVYSVFEIACFAETAERFMSELQFNPNMNILSAWCAIELAQAGGGSFPRGNLFRDGTAV